VSGVGLAEFAAAEAPIGGVVERGAETLFTGTAGVPPALFFAAFCLLPCAFFFWPPANAGGSDLLLPSASCLLSFANGAESDLLGLPRELAEDWSGCSDESPLLESLGFIHFRLLVRLVRLSRRRCHQFSATEISGIRLCRIQKTK
jgi:hypothetical protein